MFAIYHRKNDPQIPQTSPTLSLFRIIYGDLNVFGWKTWDSLGSYLLAAFWDLRCLKLVRNWHVGGYEE